MNKSMALLGACALLLAGAVAVAAAVVAAVTAFINGKLGAIK